MTSFGMGKVIDVNRGGMLCLRSKVVYQKAIDIYRKLNQPDLDQDFIARLDNKLKKLQYELTMEKVKSGQLNKSDLKKAENELKQAEQKFQDFWNSFGIGD